MRRDLYEGRFWTNTESETREAEGRFSAACATIKVVDSPNATIARNLMRAKSNPDAPRDPSQTGIVRDSSECGRL